MSLSADVTVELLLKDRDWRLNSLYTILTEQDGFQPFVARAEQLEFRKRRHHCNFIPKARKLGMSTEIVTENLDSCIFEPNFHAAIIDLSEPDAWDKLEIARRSWNNGPKHPDPAIREVWQKIQARNPLKKDTQSYLEWSNGSVFEAGVSFTGGTLNALHVSEYGPIAAQHPDKAANIRRGSLNAVVQNGFKVIETTMEGGRMGPCFDFFELALSNGVRDDLEKGEWRLHFFSWLNHPHYRLPGRAPTNADTIEYFASLKKQYGLDVPLDRQAWYEMKKREQKDEMYQQFPTVIQECVRTVVAGQIYPEMIDVRAESRASKPYKLERSVPVCAYFDLGSGANLAGWMIQKTYRDINVFDWAYGEGKGAAYMAELIRHWESEHGVQIACIFLPHDADISDKGSGKTYRTQLVEAGIPNWRIKVVPKVVRVWDGIAEVAKRIPRMWFHPRCDVQVEVETPDGISKLPGGVGRLEGYRRTPNSSSGVIKAVPLGDICSHTADALRTFAEADWHNLVDNIGGAGPSRPMLPSFGQPGFDPFAKKQAHLVKRSSFTRR